MARDPQADVCVPTHRKEWKRNRDRKGSLLAWKAQRTSYPFSVEAPIVIPLSLSSVVYTQCILVFILFRFDDGAKLKKRNSGDVSYLKKSVS